MIGFSYPCLKHTRGRVTTLKLIWFKKCCSVQTLKVASEVSGRPYSISQTKHDSLVWTRGTSVSFRIEISLDLLIYDRVLCTVDCRAQE